MILEMAESCFVFISPIEKAGKGREGRKGREGKWN
jgi:hypothetical protein